MALGKYALFALGLSTVYVALPVAKSSLPLAFDVPAQTAIGRLQAERRLVQGTGLGSLRIRGAGMSGESVLISITRAGDERSVTCRVDVAAPSPASSTAEVSCLQPDVEKGGMRSLGAGAFEIVVREHVAATIAQRPYDVDSVADRMIAFMIANRSAISAQMKERMPEDGNASAAAGNE